MTLVDIHIKTSVSRDEGMFAAVLTTANGRKEIQGADTLTTPQRMELDAAIAALSTLRRRCVVELHTDSLYVLQGATKWFPLALPWFFSDTSSHKMRNQILWGKLFAVARLHDIQWHGPRRNTADECRDLVMARGASEVWGRTAGDGPDIGYVYTGDTEPWSDALGAYRPFTDDEIAASKADIKADIPDDLASTVCSPVSIDADAERTLTAKQKADRLKIIVRVAERFRPESIRPRKGVDILSTFLTARPRALNPTHHQEQHQHHVI